MTKWLRIAALALVPIMSACTEDPIIDPDADPGEDVATIRLTVATQTIDIGPGGASLSLDLPRGTTTITATFLRANGTTLTLPSTGAFAVNFASNNTNRMTFTRTGNFTGTLTAGLAGPAILSVELLHGSHTDFGPHNVTVNVQPPTDTDN
jgi:hypothetical protein